MTITITISAIISYLLNLQIKKSYLTIITFILFLIPASEITIQITQYILSKIVKPKLIPKLDFQNGIPVEYSTMVVIPTILRTKEQVKELINKLEVFYIANKSENLYFTLLEKKFFFPSKIKLVLKLIKFEKIEFFKYKL